MSQFLPEGFGQQGAVSALPKDAVSDGDISLIKKTLSRPEVIQQVAPNFFAYMVDYLSVNQPLVPISQISGFSQFTAKFDLVATAQSTSSTSFVDLGTVGPQLTGLPRGSYVILFGAQYAKASGATMSVSLNGASADVEDGATTAVNTGAGMSIMRAVAKTLTDPESNSVVVKYKSDDGGSSSWQNRWLIVLRYANI